jgi:integrase
MRGKGGRGRTVRLTKAADEALDRWLAVHPLRREMRGAAAPVLPATAPLFCTLGRHGRPAHSPTGRLQVGRPLSADALERLVARHARRAGIPTAFGHPHVLRRYYLTRLADLGEPVHKLAAFAGHADIRVTQQYLAVGDPEAAEAVDRIDAHATARAGREPSVPCPSRSEASTLRTAVRDSDRTGGSTPANHLAQGVRVPGPRQSPGLSGW